MTATFANVVLNLVTEGKAAFESSNTTTHYAHPPITLGSGAILRCAIHQGLPGTSSHREICGDHWTKTKADKAGTGEEEADNSSLDSERVRRDWDKYLLNALECLIEQIFIPITTCSPVVG